MNKKRRIIPSDRLKLYQQPAIERALSYNGPDNKVEEYADCLIKYKPPVSKYMAGKALIIPKDVGYWKGVYLRNPIPYRSITLSNWQSDSYLVDDGDRPYWHYGYEYINAGDQLLSANRYEGFRSTTHTTGPLLLSGFIGSLNGMSFSSQTGSYFYNHSPFVILGREHLYSYYSNNNVNQITYYGSLNYDVPEDVIFPVNTLEFVASIYYELERKVSGLSTSLNEFMAAGNAAIRKRIAWLKKNSDFILDIFKDESVSLVMPDRWDTSIKQGWPQSSYVFAASEVSVEINDELVHESIGENGGVIATLTRAVDISYQKTIKNTDGTETIEDVTDSIVGYVEQERMWWGNVAYTTYNNFYLTPDDKYLNGIFNVGYGFMLRKHTSMLKSGDIVDGRTQYSKSVIGFYSNQFQAVDSKFNFAPQWSYAHQAHYHQSEVWSLIPYNEDLTVTTPDIIKRYIADVPPSYDKRAEASEQKSTEEQKKYIPIATGKDAEVSIVFFSPVVDGESIGIFPWHTDNETGSDARGATEAEIYGSAVYGYDPESGKFSFKKWRKLKDSTGNVVESRRVNVSDLEWPDYNAVVRYGNVEWPDVAALAKRESAERHDGGGDQFMHRIIQAYKGAI